MEEKSYMTITDDSGQEKEVEIILTFDDDNSQHFVLFTDPNDPEGNVYAYKYDEDGNMDDVSDAEEWQMCQEVLGAFQNEEEKNGG